MIDDNPCLDLKSIRTEDSHIRLETRRKQDAIIDYRFLVFYVLDFIFFGLWKKVN